MNLSFEIRKDCFSITLFKNDAEISYIKSLLEKYDKSKNIKIFTEAIEIFGRNDTLNSGAKGYQLIHEDNLPSSRLTCPNPFKKWMPSVFSK